MFIHCSYTQTHTDTRKPSIVLTVFVFGFCFAIFDKSNYAKQQATANTTHQSIKFHKTKDADEKLLRSVCHSTAPWRGCNKKPGCSGLKWAGNDLVERRTKINWDNNQTNAEEKNRKVLKVTITRMMKWQKIWKEWSLEEKKRKIK